MPDYMRLYFEGERAIGLFAVPAGLALAGLATYGLRAFGDQALFRAWGLGVLTLGAVAVLAGAGMWIKTRGDVRRLETAYSQAPAATVANETARMTRVNANWPRLKLVWSALTLIGLATASLAAKPAWTGVGLTLLLVGTLGFSVDIPAEVRAKVYSQHLEQDHVQK